MSAYPERVLYAVKQIKPSHLLRIHRLKLFTTVLYTPRGTYHYRKWIWHPEFKSSQIDLPSTTHICLLIRHGSIYTPSNTE